MLKTKFCKIALENPLFLAAGVLGSNASSLNWALESGAGGVVTKSFSKNPNEGYKNPTTVAVEGGIINAIGLSNPGVEVFKEELKRINSSKENGIFASIYGSTPLEFSEIAGEIEEFVDAIELNISCPHAMCGYGSSIGENPDLTYEFVKAVKDNVSIPVIAKLTPNVTDITKIAIASEKAGADGVTLINSLGPGMKIDISTAKPILSNKFGGMSGPAIKPIAIKSVFDVYKSVEIPIMGVGGISNYLDVVEFLYAGASVVQIGTSIMDHGLEIFSRISKDLENFMKDNDLNSIDEIVGLVHKGGFQ
ncbi:MAG: dihydroorotate dehydrogenase [Methanobacteriaceae archaeon]|jgi:dihydroorotate dehydrogenase (NAD+) catalytic subunit|nr:dihydroorotate dehydrogenase [Methanobacteriaceae archaeon]